MSTFHQRSPIGFAHRGGLAHFRENTLEAFRHALKSGLKGLETDARLTSDGQVVLNHDSHVWVSGLPRRISKLTRHSLPGHIPTLAELCELIGPEADVQIDVKGNLDTAKHVINTWRSWLPGSMHKLWLASDGDKESDRFRLVSWRALDPQVRLVDTTKVARFDQPAELYARRDADLGIEVINLRAKEWTKSLVQCVHDAGLLAFGFDAQKPAVIDFLINIGLDGVYSDHVDRLLAALKR